MKNNLSLEFLLMYAVGLIIFSALILFSISGCQTAPKIVQERISLHWETGEEQKTWSDALIKYVDRDFDLYEKAQDTSLWCPKYKSLSRQQKLKAWGEMWVSIAFYESGFRPKTASVDVGQPDKRDTWSVGLYQVSVVDQPWAGGGTTYSYEDLLTPIPNIHLATILMKRQLTRTGLLILPVSSKYKYWAVILSGGKWQKIPEIIARTQKHASFCK